MTHDKVVTIIDNLNQEEFQAIAHEAVSYSFTTINDVSKRFGKEWRTEISCIRKLIDEAFIQGYLTALDRNLKNGKSQGQETGIQDPSAACG